MIFNVSRFTFNFFPIYPNSSNLSEFFRLPPIYPIYPKNVSRLTNFSLDTYQIILYI